MNWYHNILPKVKSHQSYLFVGTDSRYSPWNVLLSHFFRAFTVRWPCVHMRSPLRSVRIHHSKSADCALTVRSPFAQSVFIHFHLELQNERIGLRKMRKEPLRKGGRKLMWNLKYIFLSRTFFFTLLNRHYFCLFWKWHMYAVTVNFLSYAIQRFHFW